MYLFQLGREYKLSIAEVVNVFPEIEIQFLSKEVLIGSVRKISREEIISRMQSMGGVIKLAEKTKQSISDVAENHDGKFQYGISTFGKKEKLQKILLKQKKELKALGISSRFVNKNFNNLNSAQIIGEKLVKKGTDFSMVSLKGDTVVFKTLWIQDIDAYSKRDYGKSRDMQVGMLPPKLCQIMLNIASGDSVYDPFVGLGTILIEAVHSGKTKVYGSDISEHMVDISIENLKALMTRFAFDYDVQKLNAKFVDEFSSIKEVDSIVTEGYLGEVMTRSNISFERIEKQKLSLEKIYKGFFSSLKKSKYKGNIVICFPFWEIAGKYIYADNIYNILAEYCKIEKIITSDFTTEITSDIYSPTKSGSYLYKRKDQLVGREIFKLTIN